MPGSISIPHPLSKSLSIALTIFSLSVPFTAFAQETRTSVMEFSKNPENVQKLEKAIQVMKDRGSKNPQSAEFRTSFTYWANTHGFFGSGDHATDLNKVREKRYPSCVKTLGKKQCDEYYAHLQLSVVPDDGITKDVWGTCQHGTNTFLPWHRFYLAFFERTLQSSINDNSFALPYWNYYDEVATSSQTVKPNELALPALVKNTSSLYNTWRTPGLNDGSTGIERDAANAKQAFDFVTFTRFSNALESQPHGAMHCAVGTGCSTPDMGFVPVAGLDPVFYMHHANIDRLWQCWMDRKAKGQKQDLAWAKKNLEMPDSWFDTQFTFANEKGERVDVKVADLFDETKFPRRYEDNLVCDETRPTPKLSNNQNMRLAGGLPLLHLGKSLSLTGERVKTSLTPASRTLLQSRKAVVTDDKKGIYLVLDDVVIDASSTVTYHIYIANKAFPEKRIHVSTFNLFGLEAHSHGDHGSQLVFNVTDELHELAITKASDLVLDFVPTTLSSLPLPANKSATIKIGNIQLENLLIQ